MGKATIKKDTAIYFSEDDEEFDFIPSTDATPLRSNSAYEEAKESAIKEIPELSLLEEEVISSTAATPLLVDSAAEEAKDSAIKENPELSLPEEEVISFTDATPLLVDSDDEEVTDIPEMIASTDSAPLLVDSADANVVKSGTVSNEDSKVADPATNAVVSGQGNSQITRGTNPGPSIPAGKIIPVPSKPLGGIAAGFGTGSAGAGGVSSTGVGTTSAQNGGSSTSTGSGFGSGNQFGNFQA